MLSTKTTFKVSAAVVSVFRRWSLQVTQQIKVIMLSMSLCGPSTIQTSKGIAPCSNQEGPRRALPYSLLHTRKSLLTLSSVPVGLLPGVSLLPISSQHILSLSLQPILWRCVCVILFTYHNCSSLSLPYHSHLQQKTCIRHGHHSTHIYF